MGLQIDEVRLEPFKSLVTSDHFKEDPILKDTQIIRTRVGSNFKLSEDEANILAFLWESRRPEFETKVSKLMREKIFSKPTGNESPSKQIKETICENCNQSAPFLKDKGEFYLEVHHLRRLADGGSDTIRNAIAVCPNCHRELHYGAERETLLNGLYEQVNRLEREGI